MHTYFRFWPVFLRNLLVWRKLAIPSLVANIAEPLMWLVAFGYGLGALVGEVTLGEEKVPYRGCVKTRQHPVLPENRPLRSSQDRRSRCRQGVKDT